MTARLAIAGLAGTLFIAIACSENVQESDEGAIVTRPNAAPDAFAARDTYSNQLYGFQVTYPTGMFQPEPAPRNNDGRLFNGPRGAQFRVYGSHNALGLDFGEQVDRKRELFAQLTEDRQEGDSWTGFGPAADGGWMAVRLIRVSDTQVITTQFTAPEDASMEMRDTGRQIVASLRKMDSQSGS